MRKSMETIFLKSIIFSCFNKGSKNLFSKKNKFFFLCFELSLQTIFKLKLYFHENFLATLLYKNDKKFSSLGKFGWKLWFSINHGNSFLKIKWLLMFKHFILLKSFLIKFFLSSRLKKIMESIFLKTQLFFIKKMLLFFKFSSLKLTHSLFLLH